MKKILILITLLGIADVAACQDKATMPDPIQVQVTELHPAIASVYKARKKHCSLPQKCGNLIAIDCHSSTDGPLTYYDNNTGEVVMECGGACMAAPHDENRDSKRCTTCPPSGWVCK